MSQHELLVTVLSFLEEHRVEYMVTGSVVSSIQGQPRATHDIDIVVNIPLTAVQFLVNAFKPPHYYVSAEAVQDAIRRKFMFNLLDTTGGDKVDFWMLTDEPFDKSRFERRYREEMPGLSMFVSRPEDTILAKLRWAKLSGGSEKQMTDARRVFEVQGDLLDLAYISKWVTLLQVDEEWKELQKSSKSL